MKKKNTSTVAIVGAGPAGAMCAYELARAGVDVALFDHKAPWEKPCGGMLSQRVFDEFPVMREYPYPRREFDRITIISNRLHTTVKELRSPLFTVSRKDLGQYLQDIAIAQGAVFIPEKVRVIHRNNKAWKVESDSVELISDILIGADGAHSIVRKTMEVFTEHIQNVLTCGYYIDGVDDTRCIVRFIDRVGYIWSYPRPYDLSVGIGYVDIRENTSSNSLFEKLSAFVEEAYPGAIIREKWSHVIPIAKNILAYDINQSGECWYIIGDASCNVDPLTGEGIYYAMKSASIAAECFLERLDYINCWERSIGYALRHNVTLLNDLLAVEQGMGADYSGALFLSMFSNIV